MFRFAIFTFLLLYVLVLSAQTAIISEDFNDCTLPSDWTVTYSNSTAVDATVVTSDPSTINNNSDGSTIDGSCMVIVDDDGVGDGTPPVNVKFTTPSFDATQNSVITLDLDLHFRQYETSYLNINVFDGTQYVTIATFTGGTGNTGTQFSEFIHLTYDLTYYANPNMSIQIEFDDDGVWAWWAGFDNFVVTGTGTATNLLVENFDACGLPSGWTTSIVTGVDDWQFNAGTDNTNGSMNGSCMAYFDDDGLGNEAVFSTAQLISPVIDGTLFGNMYLDFDIIFRQYTELENVAIYVFDGTTLTNVETYYDTLGGPAFNQFIHITLDLSYFRSEQMQIVFQYDDGDDWGWWVGIDNVRVSGEGSINDLCTTAFGLNIGQPCLEGNNETALFQGNQPSCNNNNVGALWYQFNAPSTGVLKIESNADYNDLLTIFEGTCNSLSESLCSNWDEFGFVGETLYMNITSGNDYFIRVSGINGNFGKAKGDLCIELEQVANIPPPPSNDLCANAVALTMNGSCLNGNNFDATFEGPVPSLNTNSRSDIWYQFTATNAGNFEIETNANFADVITLYSGTCGNLTEIAGNDKGQSLEVSGLTNGTNYFVQVSGFFATIEGNVCMEVREVFTVPPSNDLCSTAQTINLGSNCTIGNNQAGTFNGPKPSCEVYPSSNIWYQFTTPASGNIQINTGADFVHAVSIYSGDCNNLEEVFCQNNPLSCEGYFAVGGLNSGETYFMQIASARSHYDETEAGSICLQILDGNDAPVFQTLELSVEVMCEGGGMGRLSVQTNGGFGSYTYEGNSNNELLADGEAFLVIVTDDNGCQQAVSGTIDCSDTSCTNNTTACTCDELAIEGDQMTDYIYQAAVSIVSDATIDANITYKAGESIELTAGFTTELGNEFLAIIEACDLNALTEVAGIPPLTSVETSSVSMSGNQSEMLLTKETIELHILPNIVNDKSQLEYYLPQNETIHLEIHSITGQKIRVLEQAKNKAAGYYQMTLENLANLESGTYYVLLQTEQERVTRKFIVIRE